MGTTGRILAGVVVTILVLGFAVLELVSEKTQLPRQAPEASPTYLADGEVREQDASLGVVHRIVVLSESYAAVAP